MIRGCNMIEMPKQMRRRDKRGKEKKKRKKKEKASHWNLAHKSIMTHQVYVQLGKK